MSGGVTGRRWLDDLLRAAAFLVLGLVLWLVVPEISISWWPHPVDVGPTATALTITVASLALVLRSRHPLVSLSVTTGVLLVGVVGTGHTALGVVLCFADALYSAVLLGSRRAAWTVSGLAAAVTLLVALVSLADEGGRAAVVSLLNLGMLLAVPVFWGMEVRWHAEIADAERARAEQANRLAAMSRAAAVAAERARMARDLHDVIAGQLSAIAIQSEAVLSIPDADPATLRTVLASVRRDSVASLGEMRTMIGLLRADGSGDTDPRTAPAGLDRVDELLATARATGLDVTVSDRRDPADLVPAATDLAAYRIVQEALTNAAKHAPGSAVTLTLAQDDGRLTVEVTNPLVAGAPPGGGTGTGLLGLQERAGAVGGSITAGADGDRWRLRAVLPVPAPVGSTS
ncbi:sensor histidine kinase [Pseudonocardia sp. CA-107938]|uniref:sensor histidine kinase n=1 Tax=Pseudonocardia sp. CA-107938 TaxID=3240021 RepID=UPI003D8EDA5A